MVHSTDCLSWWPASKTYLTRSLDARTVENPRFMSYVDEVEAALASLSASKNEAPCLVALQHLTLASRLNSESFRGM